MREIHKATLEERVLLAWRELLQESRQRPWLASLLARRGAHIFDRFVQFYRQLRRLPRRVRRALGLHFRRRLATTLLGAALLFALSPTPVAHAATITVDGSTCTLPDAITAANTDTATGGCTAGDGADTIDLQTDVTLSGDLPTITSEMTLQGNGHTIDGNDSVTHVLGIDNAAFTLNESVITGGNAIAGGGVYNDNGLVTINESTITGNAATYDGGGIHNFYGTMTINNSTISGNTSTYGGGLANLDTMTVNNSTITGNTANLGGGLYSGPGGSVTVNRSIISGNTAIDQADEIHHSSFETDLNIDNNNVFGYGGSPRSVNVTPGASDIVPAAALNTVLDASLADNGGLTPTHALVGGSVAIDVAPDADCTVSPIDGIDQRNYARNTDGDAAPSSEECDAGAFEFNSGPTAIELALMQAHSAAQQRGLLAGLGALALSLFTLGHRWWRRAIP